jgi:ABC-type sugar transport system permease subunit
MLAVTAYPIGYAIWLSLQRYDLRFAAARQFVALANYATVLGSSPWWTAFGVTLFITVVSVAVELVLGMGLALIMRWALVGRGAVRTAILVPYGIVTVVAAYSWQHAWTPATGYLANLLGSGSAPLTRQWPAIFILTSGANNTRSVSILGYDNLFTALNLGIGSAISVLIVIAVAVIAFIFITAFGTAAPGQEVDRR